MSVAQYGLTWDSHKNHVCGGFLNLQQNEEFVDLTIAADGHLVNVHKSVLALASPYIKSMIQATATPHPVIFLNNVSHEILSYILQYVYTGEVFVDTNEIKPFMKAAQDLRIAGLRDLEAPKVDGKEAAKRVDKKMKIPIKITHDHKATISNKYTNTAVKYIATNSDSINTEQQPVFNDINFLEPSINQAMTNSEVLNNIPVCATHNNDIEQQAVLGEISFHDPMISETVPNDGMLSTAATDNLSVNNIGVSQPAVCAEIKIGSSTSQLFPNQDLLIATGATNDSHLNNVQTEKQITVLDNISLLDSQNASISYQGIQNNSNNSDSGFHMTADGYQFKIDLFDLNSKYDSKVEPVNVDVDNFHHLQEQNDKSNNSASLPAINIDCTAGTSCSTKDSLDPKVLVPQYTMSNRGCLQLILNRYMYYCHHQSQGGRKRRWRCIDYRRVHCPAFIDTDCEVMSVRKYPHAHSYHDDKIMKKINSNLVFTNLNTVIQRLNATKS